MAAAETRFMSRRLRADARHRRIESLLLRADCAAIVASLEAERERCWVTDWGGLRWLPPGEELDHVLVPVDPL